MLPQLLMEVMRDIQTERKAQMAMIYMSKCGNMEASSSHCPILAHGLN